MPQVVRRADNPRTPPPLPRCSPAHLVAKIDETREHGHDVAAHLHGDHAHVVLLVGPHQRVARVVVVDATGVRPVAVHRARDEKGRVGLLEEEVLLAHLLLLLVRHAARLGRVRVRAGKRIVVALELTVERHERVDDLGLDLAALGLGARRRERNARERAARAHARRADARGVLGLGLELIQFLEADICDLSSPHPRSLVLWFGIGWNLNVLLKRIIEFA